MTSKPTRRITLVAALVTAIAVLLTFYSTASATPFNLTIPGTVARCSRTTPITNEMDSTTTGSDLIHGINKFDDPLQGKFRDGSAQVREVRCGERGCIHVGSYP